VSAYNSTLGGQTWTEGNDYVKVLAVGAAVPTRVAEPGSLALIAAAGLGACVVRRRRNA
jgi:hypothetical protein